MEKLKMENPFVEGSGVSIISSKDLNKLKEPVQSIDIADILSPKFHDRKNYSQESIEELAANILCNKGSKLLQPIVVRATEEGYERIIGFRRIEAYKFLNRKQIETIILTDISDEEAMLIMLSENIQRVDPNLYDQTIGIISYIAVSLGKEEEEVKKMLYKFRNIDSKIVKNSEDLITERDKVEHITKKLGKISVATLINRLKVFSLHEDILELLKKGKISYTAAVEVNKAKDDNQREYLLKKIKEDDLSIKGIKAYLLSFNLATKKSAVNVNYKIRREGDLTELSIRRLTDVQIKSLKLFLETL